jgi:hypothetical protein
MNTPYTITKEKDNIVIRVPSQMVDEASLVKLLDYLELESVRRRSQLTGADAAGLANEVKQNAWQQVKHLFKE